MLIQRNQQINQDSLLVFVIIIQIEIEAKVIITNTIMNLRILLQILSFIKIIQSVEVSLSMEDLVNVQQNPKITQIILKPGQVYQHYSDLFQPLQYVNASCHASNGELTETQIVNFPITTTILDNLQHIYVEKYGTIYRLQHQTLIAYRFSQITKQLTLIQKLQFGNSHCKGQIALSADQQHLYHFACQKITRIQMKKSLTGIKIIQQLKQAFYGHKVLSGPDFFIWASYSEGLRVYAIDSYQNLMLLQTLQKFAINNIEQKIADLTFKDNHLYVLGSSNIFVYTKLGNGYFTSKTNISLANVCSDCNHRQIIAHYKNLYIYSIENGEEFISEIQQQKQFEKISLIRYFKGYRNFASMTIFDGKLMTCFNHLINLYEINKDPRTITKLLNGISNVHVDQISKFERISSNLFVKTYQETSSIIRFSLKKPFYSCKYEQQFKQAKTLQVKQPCAQIQNINQNRYYYSCSAMDIVTIKVQKEKGSHHLLAVVTVFLFCACVVIMLMLWRKGKIDLIQNIVTQINKLKKRNKQRIQFVEEKAATRQSNWNDIQDSYGVQQKQHQAQEQFKQQEPELEEQLGEQLQDHKHQGTQRNMIEVQK